jgi:beta-aspartyl-peptidase (threonine type)
MAPQLPLPTKVLRALAVLSAWCALGTADAVAAKTTTHAPRLAPLERFVVGDIGDADAGSRATRTLVIGGGEHDPDAMTSFLERAGHGHVVVLRASMTTDVADAIFSSLAARCSLGGNVCFRAMLKLRWTRRRCCSARRRPMACSSPRAATSARGMSKCWKHAPVARPSGMPMWPRASPSQGPAQAFQFVGAISFLLSAPPGRTFTVTLRWMIQTGRDITIESDFLHFDVMEGYAADTRFDERVTTRVA